MVLALSRAPVLPGTDDLVNEVDGAWAADGR
jgi:hypothetical protein